MDTPDADFECVQDAGKVRTLLEDIFTDSFMRQNTRFQSFAGFRYSSAVFLNWDADTWIYSRRLLDGFVKESTCYPTWEAMVRAGTEARYHTPVQ